MTTKKTNTAGSIQKEEVKINKSLMYATWANTIIALIALGISIYAVWLSSESRKENFQVTYARIVKDAPAQIVEKPSASTDTTTGIINTYAEFYLSNNGENNISITSHDITEITDEFGTNKPIQYFPTQDTYYIRKDGKFLPYDYPLVIEAGHSQRIYSPIELIMAPKAYSLMKEKFGSEVSSGLSIITIDDFLSSYDIDLYGNRIGPDSVTGSPTVFITNEQIFLITFTSSRNVEKKYLFSLYVYNDLYFMPPP